LAAAKAELKKISGIGEEMDGNTTTNEEEEFIDALKDEMPEVFKNIEANFGLLDHIDSELKLVLKYKDINKMQAVKKDLDEASVKVDQCESLVVKLDNEVIEWDAFKKLCRRDDELNELEKLVEDLSKDLEGEM
jgi:N-acetyl-beta-hexosaminidase